MQSIAVIDYGASNLRSVSKALSYVADKHSQIIVSDKAEEIFAADKIVFPGQGAMGQCMTSLSEKGLDKVLLECVNNKPFLGICLGLQSLMQESEENECTPGLGIIPGRVVKFTISKQQTKKSVFKIPHMGWNSVAQEKPHTLWKGIESEARFYFVHSYYVVPDEKKDIVATSDYVVDFTAAVARDNLFATQFHPEKSQQAGLTLLSNFLNWNP
jgi:imidazole glycerol-phosphate synthase subunit HisH